MRQVSLQQCRHLADYRRGRGSAAIQQTLNVSLFAYPMSGGFQKWSLMPAALVGSMLAFEDRVPEAVRRRIAFRMLVVVEILLMRLTLASLKL